MTLFAQHWTWNNEGLAAFAMSLTAAAIFGLLGIALLAVGFKVFEWITPKLNVEEELGKGNIAVGIVVAGSVLGVAFIVVRAIGG